MINLLREYPRFNKKGAKDQQTEYAQMYDSYDQQNDESARTFLLNSLKKSLKKTILQKVNEEDGFAVVLMTFVKHERPISGELYESIEQKILNIDIRKYPQRNITKMVKDLQVLLNTLDTANAWDSKNNPELCRILVEAGSPPQVKNEEYSLPLNQKLTQVKKAVISLNHLNNKDKHLELMKSDLDWKNILEEAESLHGSLTVSGRIRWPFMQDAKDTRTPKQEVNLTQATDVRNQAPRGHKKPKPLSLIHI